MAGDRTGLAAAQRVGAMRRIQSSNSRRTSAVSKSLDLGAPGRIMSDSGAAGLTQVRAMTFYEWAKILANESSSMHDVGVPREAAM